MPSMLFKKPVWSGLFDASPVYSEGDLGPWILMVGTVIFCLVTLFGGVIQNGQGSHWERLRQRCNISRRSLWKFSCPSAQLVESGCPWCPQGRPGLQLTGICTATMLCELFR